MSSNERIFWTAALFPFAQLAVGFIRHKIAEYRSKRDACSGPTERREPTL